MDDQFSITSLNNQQLDPLIRNLQDKLQSLDRASDKQTLFDEIQNDYLQLQSIFHNFFLNFKGLINDKTSQSRRSKVNDIKIKLEKSKFQWEEEKSIELLRENASNLQNAINQLQQGKKMLREYLISNDNILQILKKHSNTNNGKLKKLIVDSQKISQQFMELPQYVPLEELTLSHIQSTVEYQEQDQTKQIQETIVQKEQPVQKEQIIEQGQQDNKQDLQQAELKIEQMIESSKFESDRKSRRPKSLMYPQPINIPQRNSRQKCSYDLSPLEQLQIRPNNRKKEIVAPPIEQDNFFSRLFKKILNPCIPDNE